MNALPFFASDSRSIALSTTSPQEVAFFDSRVENLQSLVAGISPGIAVVIVDSNRDGVQQMAEWSSIHAGISAIHVIGHGSEGSVCLGTATLNAYSINQYRSALSQIGQALTTDGDILLYGCNVGAGMEGIDFVRSLASVIGADIAASTDLTGSADRGGNWILETATGPIDTAALGVSGALTGWSHVLAAPVIASPSFAYAAPVDYVTGVYHSAVDCADFNGDGKADLVVVNDYAGSVSILINKGNGILAAPVGYAIGSLPNSLSCSDVNGDGKTDLIVANSSGVSVLMNKGNGTFVDKVDYATAGLQPCAVVSADVNGDGKIDLIVANMYNYVSVLVNTGNGTFVGKVDYAAPSYPQSVVCPDVNGDNMADLIVADAYDSRVSVLINKGDGTFAGKVDYLTVSGSSSVTSADVNSDGKADLLVANTDSVSVLMNKGDGTFADKVDYATDYGTLSVISTDINGDGKIDLIAANAVGSLSMLTNKGDGTFYAKVDCATSTMYPQSVASADVNGDGKADLVVVGKDVVSLFVNTANVTSTAFTEQTPVAVCNGLNVSDADGDANWNGGQLKIQISANYETGDCLRLATEYHPITRESLIWLDTSGNKLMAGDIQIGTADNVFVGNNTVWTLTFNSAATNLLVQEVARAVVFDNTSDTPGTSLRTVTFTAIDNRGLGTTATQSITVTAVNDAPVNTVSSVQSYVQDSALTFGTAHGNALSVADADTGDNPLRVTLTASHGTLSLHGTAGLSFTEGDGAADAVLSFAGSQASINAALDGLIFTPAAGYHANAAIQITTSDQGYSGSGKALTDTDTIALHVSPEDLSRPTFASKADYAAETAWSTLVADINGDGKSDLIVPEPSLGTVSVLTNRAGGVFADKVDYVVGGTPWSVVSTDVNNDDKTDLIVVNADGISVLINKGNGVFADKVDCRSLFYASNKIISADINGDGKADLVIQESPSGYCASSLSVLVNKGDGTFSDKVGYDTGTSMIANQFSSEDVNSDGKTDLIALTDRGVSILINKGNGTFATPIECSMSHCPISLSSADVNGDGKVDLVILNAENRFVSVLVNKGDGTFAAKVDYTTGSSGVIPQSVTSADVNSDGKADLIVATNRGISVLLNAGSGSLASGVEYTTSQNDKSGPTNIKIADLNSDGSADIVAGNLQGTVSVLTNHGDGTFASHVDFSVSDGAYASKVISCADLNGDGKADLSVASGDRLSVLMNTTNGDGDNVSLAVEAQATDRLGAISGDGNNDGIQDNTQGNVTSSPFNNSLTGRSSYITLVADSATGVIDTSDAGSALLTHVVQLPASTDKPAGLSSPLGQIDFTAALSTSGLTETFSLFVSDDTPVNGYWKQDTHGNWANLASAIEHVGKQIRVDFAIRDGGVFDADGLTNGIIVDAGSIGYLPRPSATLEKQITGLYVAFYDRAPDAAGLAYWENQVSGGSATFYDIAKGFAQHPRFAQDYGGLSNAAIAARFYTNVLGNADDAAGIAYWKGQLDQGRTVSQAVSDFVQTSLNVDLLAARQAGKLTDAEFSLTYQRQNLLDNKVKAGLDFAALLGESTVPHNAATELSSDTAYAAAVHVLDQVNADPSSAYALAAELLTLVGTADPMHGVMVLG